MRAVKASHVPRPAGSILDGQRDSTPCRAPILVYRRPWLVHQRFGALDVRDASGSVHVVRGHKVRIWPGVTVCHKRQWTLRNTFIHTDDYVDQPERVAALDPNVVLALGDCGVLYRPDAWREVPDPDLI